VEQIGKGERYNVIQKVICICISNYELFAGVDGYLNSFKFYNPKNGLCFEVIPEEVYTLELPKVPVKSDGTTGWEWMLFLRGKQREEFDMIAEKNPEIRKAVNTLYELSADEKVRAEYEMRQKAWRDRVSQIEGAYEDGKIDVAEKLKKMGLLTTDQISAATNLSKEVIEKL
jgi:predicted transposase/invertase (TIGR01784 family)